MIINIDFATFVDAFDSMDRRDNFTLSGLRELFDYMEDFEQDAGRPIELDVIALCCEYVQDDWQAVADNYSIVYDADVHDTLEDAVLDYLEDETVVVYSDDDTVLYQLF